MEMIHYEITICFATVLTGLTSVQDSAFEQIQISKLLKRER